MSKTADQKPEAETRIEAGPNPQAEGLSFAEASIISGVGRSTLYVAARARALRVRKLGHRSLIMRDDLNAWLRALPEAYS